MRGRRGGVTIAAGATPGGKVHRVVTRHCGRVVALDHGMVGRTRRAAGEGVGVTVVGGPACRYTAATDMAHRLGAGVGVVRVRVSRGDGLVGGCRGHGTCSGDRLAVHCLVAGLGIGVRNRLDLGRVLRDGLVLLLVRVLLLMLMLMLLVLVLVLVLHLVLWNRLHRHRRTRVHVESYRSGSVVDRGWVGQLGEGARDEGRRRLIYNQPKFIVKLNMQRSSKYH